MVDSDRGDFERAEGLLKESLALIRAAGTDRDVGVVLNALAMLALSRGDHGRAAALQEESLSLARQAGDARSVAIYTHNLGWAAMAGEYGRAEAFAQGAEELLREVGDREVGGLNTALLGFLALSQRNFERAEWLCAAAMRGLREFARRWTSFIPWTSWGAPPPRKGRSPGPRGFGARRRGLAKTPVLPGHRRSAC